MSILVTGATGEIGSSLLDSLADRAHVRATSRRMQPVASSRANWVQADLLDSRSLERACRGARIVVHMAAMTHTARAADYFAVNVQGTANLIAAAEHAGAELFVQVSTRAIGAGGGAYSHSKEAAEAVVRESTLPWVVLRPAEVYGTGGHDPVLSLAKSLPTRSFVPILGDGSYELSPVCVQDVVGAIVNSVERSCARGQTYVLAGPETMSFTGLVERLEKMLMLSPRRRFRVPLWLARLLFTLGGRLGVGPYVPDQLPRLLLPKSSDITAAVRDLDYAPRTVEVGLRPLLGLPNPESSTSRPNDGS